MRLAAVALILALAACGQKQEQAKRGPQANQNVLTGNEAGVTPMNERVAVLGFLNKRNGIVQELRLRPGQSVRVKDAVVLLKACEMTAPWEAEKLIGAFVQLEVKGSDDKWRRVFSGWLYKESPSLNVVQHPVYDVWPKSCAMTFPAGPPAPAAPAASSNRSSARNSGSGARPRGDEAAPPAAEAPAPAPSPSATDSNAT